MSAKATRQRAALGLIALSSILFVHVGAAQQAPAAAVVSSSVGDTSVGAMPLGPISAGPAAASTTTVAGSASVGAVSADAPAERLALTAGRSTVLGLDFDVTRVAITDPKIADAVVVQPREVLVDGKGIGTTSLIVWGKGTRRQYDVAVNPGVATLEQQFKLLFPNEDIRVSVSDDAVILTGQVSNTLTVLRAGEIATGAYSKAKVINMLELPGGQISQQVLLQVRFAEVNRSALRELGISLFGTTGRFVGRSTTQQFAAPDFDDSGTDGVAGMKFSDYLNLFFFDRREGLGGVLKALEENGSFQSLAEPNLIAYNGQEASFLAGGEFPVPIVQGITGTVTILFKEFGVRLTFKPTIAGDTIRLKVRPEVSSLDFNNGITLEGFRIPALTTRRAETEVELKDGQSFAIAGLLNNIAQNDKAAIPFLGKLPIIGALFKSRADRAERTELMVLITPRLVKPLDPDEVPALPTMPSRFLPSDADEGRTPFVDAPPLKQGDTRVKP
jgi:pilus assembly protein CpaC